MRENDRPLGAGTPAAESPRPARRDAPSGLAAPDVASGASVDGILALQRAAGNAAVQRLLAPAARPGAASAAMIQRDEAAPDVREESRRSVIVVPEKTIVETQSVRLKTKVVARLQRPSSDPSALDKIVGATAVENDIRKKTATLETELAAASGDLFNLTPDGLKNWAKRHGVTATWELEPAEVSIGGEGTAGPSGKGHVTPSLDLMKVAAKLQWPVGGAVIEMEVSGSLRAGLLLKKAEKKLLQELEKKVAEFEKEALKLEKELDEVRTAGERRKQLAAAGDHVVDAARKRRDAEVKKLRDLLSKGRISWDEFKERQATVVAKLDDEVAEAARAAMEKKHAEAQLSKASKAASDRMGRMQKLRAQMAEIGSKGKSWVFKGVVKSYGLKAAKLIAKFLPIINIISTLADLYDIAVLLKNWDKLRFNPFGGEGGDGGDPEGTSEQKPTGVGGQGGTGPADPATTPAGGDPPAGGTTPTTPDPATGGTGGKGKEPPTGTGTQTGTGRVPGKAPGKDPGGGTPGGDGGEPAPGEPGTVPGTGTTPGTGPTPGTGTGTGTGSGPGTGTVPGGKEQDEPVKPGEPGATGDGGKAGKGKEETPAGQGDKGGKGGDEKTRQKQPPAKTAKWVRLARIGKVGENDVLLFDAGSRQIKDLKGINKWTAKIGMKGSATLEVEYDGQRYRVSGVPVVVKNVPVYALPERKRGETYMVEVEMGVVGNWKLAGTNLVIKDGDKLSYTWEGEF